jgi:hypothetical protein
VAILIGLAVIRVASTSTVFTGTYDEPVHVACGMEWLQGGTYACDLQHPPLARVAVALGPYLKGLRLAREGNAPDQRPKSIYEDGNAILYSEGQYWSNLTWARFGTLPFLVLLCVVTFLWARRWFSEAAGFWAVLLLVCTSPILGHAGLATNDVACAAGAALALYQFLRWLEQPRTARWLWWGFATAFAVLCKFSNIPFLVTCFAVGLMVARRGDLRRRFAQISLAACLVLALAWIAYRCQVNPPAEFYGQHHPVIDSMISSRPLLHSVWNSVMTTPLPLSEAMIGVLDLFVHNAVGHDSYLLGQWSQSGWWYYFPVVLAVKTPIGLLLLSAVGFAVVLRGWRSGASKAPWQQILTVMFPIVILLVCLPARINLGVRHILPIYPLLAIAGLGYRRFRASPSGLSGALQRIRRLASRGYPVRIRPRLGPGPGSSQTEPATAGHPGVFRRLFRHGTIGPSRASTLRAGLAHRAHAGIYRGESPQPEYRLQKERLLHMAEVLPAHRADRQVDRSLLYRSLNDH